MGLLQRLWAAFQLGLSRPEFLADALDTPPIILAPEASIRRLRHAALHRLPLPEWSDERRQALWDLFRRAIMFFLCHELGHHARGHIDLVQERLGLDTIDELRGRGSGAGSAPAAHA